MRRLGAPRALLTPRLRLFRPGDASAHARIRSDPAVMRRVPGGAARAAAGAPGLVGHFIALWDEVGYGPWAVEDGATGAIRRVLP